MRRILVPVPDPVPEPPSAHPDLSRYDDVLALLAALPDHVPALQVVVVNGSAVTGGWDDHSDLDVEAWCDGDAASTYDAVLALEGTPRAHARSSGGMPPGSNNIWFLWEFRDIERTKRVPNVQDPGASAVSLEVENLPALLARMKAAGVVVETPGGEAVDVGGGRRAALVRSPDGLLVELMEGGATGTR